MVTVIAVLAVGALAAARAKFPLKYEEALIDYSERRNIEPTLLAAIVYEESRFRHRSKSSAGAIGLMQLMPETAGWVAEEMSRPELAVELTEPTANLALGSWYFRYLLDKYEDERLALAAYNGGEENLNKWMAENPELGPQETVDRIPFTETHQFVRRVLGTKRIYNILYPALRR
jgi:soluble lytic murein transglycosylase